MGIQVRHQCLILVAGLFVFLTGLGAARLWDEDEPQYARVAREMMLQGEWLTPTFNFHLFSDKPVLLYWLMLGSYHVFGVTEFAARFPSAVMAIGTALLTYHLGRRLFRPQVGLWAGLIMTTNVMAASSSVARRHSIRRSCSSPRFVCWRTSSRSDLAPGVILSGHSPSREMVAW